jgi:hypothetical protein
VIHIWRPGKASEKTSKGVIPPSLCEISQNASRKKKIQYWKDTCVKKKKQLYYGYFVLSLEAFLHFDKILITTKLCQNCLVFTKKKAAKPRLPTLVNPKIIDVAQEVEEAEDGGTAHAITVLETGTN